MVGAYVDTPRDDRPGGDTPRNGLPRGTTARTARMAALPLAFGGRAVAGWGRRLAGADADTVSAAMMERNAEQLFAVLGQLRGGAMKVGQALAVYESMMPAELAEPYRRALVRLQAQGPPLPARDVHRVLDEQLGRQWRTRLPEFDDVLAYIGALADPLRVPRFRFDRAWMAAQGARVADLRGAAYRETGRALTLPADHLVFLRVLTGWMNVLAQLDCTVAVRGIVEQWVPAFAE
jgi:hypothetical protein